MNVNVTEQIVQLCEFLESCLQKWTMEIDEKRKDYFYLNYFTTEQLVILRKEIAKVCNGEIGDKLIYPMLNGVRVDCNPLVSMFIQLHVKFSNPILSLRRYECNWSYDLIFLIFCIQIHIMIRNKNKTVKKDVSMLVFELHGL